MSDATITNSRHRKETALYTIRERSDGSAGYPVCAKAHLESLRGLKASKFNDAEIRRYVVARRTAGTEDSMINRELAIIRRGFTLAKEANPPLVQVAPRIPMLEEDNVGFLSPSSTTGSWRSSPIA